MNTALLEAGYKVFSRWYLVPDWLFKNVSWQVFCAFEDVARWELYFMCGGCAQRPGASGHEFIT